MFRLSMTAIKLEHEASVRKWLLSIGESTRPSYLWHFSAFMDWVKENSPTFANMTPEEMVEYALDATPRQVNELLDSKKNYLQTMESRLSHKANANKAILSFFAHNRVNLPIDHTLRLRGNTPKVEGVLTPEDIKRVVLSSNETLQTVFLIMLGSGMGQEELINWSKTGLEDLKAQLRKDPKLVKVSLHGRKGDKNQYNYVTYIGGDALEALRRYIATRDQPLPFPKEIRKTTKPRKTKNPTAVFVNTHGEALTKTGLYRYWTRKLIRIGIKNAKGWTGTNTHEIRDVFRTLWRQSGVATEYAEFFMGHRGAFDKYGYDKTARNEDDLEARYLEALPHLNILSENKPFKVVKEEEVNKLRTELAEAKKGTNDRTTELERDLAKTQAMVKEIMEKLAKERPKT